VCVCVYFKHYKRVFNSQFEESSNVSNSSNLSRFYNDIEFREEVGFKQMFETDVLFSNIIIFRERIIYIKYLAKAEICLRISMILLIVRSNNIFRGIDNCNETSLIQPYH